MQPLFRFSSSDSCECVVLHGWIASVLGERVQRRGSIDSRSMIEYLLGIADAVFPRNKVSQNRIRPC